MRSRGGSTRTTARIPVALAWCALQAVGAAAMPCPPEGATITIVADNQSADAAVTVDVSGARIAETGACEPDAGLGASYATTMTCNGSGQVPCGRLAGLAPGRWIHRISTRVVGSTAQRQATRNTILAAASPSVSNVVAWTIYGRTFVVDAATDTTLLGAFDAAGTYTTATGRPALVRFEPAVFPGAGSPVTIDVKHAVVQPGNQHVCDAAAICNDGRYTAYCLEASSITIDGLDDDGRPGGIVLRVGTCLRSLFRIYGNDVVLRGLSLVGTEHDAPDIPTDTIVFGGGSRRSRLERCRVSGPTLGDAVSVQDEAGGPIDGVPADIVIADSEILGAEDKGVKSDFGGVVRIERTCIHDNRNGGVQATLGGTVIAIENVVQRNLGGSAANGVFAGVPTAGSPASRLVTTGNVVRLNGARGVSVVNTGTAMLAHDLVTDNYQAGLRIESAVPAERPQAVVRGTALLCNFAPGACADGRACRTDAECSMPPCTTTPGPALAKGIGAAVVQCLAPGCLPPTTDFGITTDHGRNAFDLNANPSAPAPSGANFNVALADAVTISAVGNQWEHCSTPVLDPLDPTQCFVDQVATLDVRPARSLVSLGQPLDPRSAPAPVALRTSPGRPGAGDLVRLFGEFFNAVGAATCLPPDASIDACSAENAAAVAHNAGTVDGTRVLVSMRSPATTVSADVHAVTPTMILFTMPFDCSAPTTAVIERSGTLSAPVALCDPGGCIDRPPGSLCDDLDDVCTLDERCSADGRCVGSALDCDDGDGCTTDACTPGAGCTHVVVLDGTACGPSDACHNAPACQDGICTASVPFACQDGDACTDDGCDPASGCTHVRHTGLESITCRFGAIRTILRGLPTTRSVRKLLARIACGEKYVEAASAAAMPARRRRRLARRASNCVARFVRLADREHSIDDDFRTMLKDEGVAAREAIATTFDVR